jgi:hypothetical protein
MLRAGLVGVSTVGAGELHEELIQHHLIQDEQQRIVASRAARRRSPLCSLRDYMLGTGERAGVIVRVATLLMSYCASPRERETVRRGTAPCARRVQRSAKIVGLLRTVALSVCLFLPRTRMPLAFRASRT